VTPTLDNYLGIPGYAILYSLLVIALGLFGDRLYTLYTYLRLGQKENRFDNVPRRMLSAISSVLFQRCSFKSVSARDWAGIGHVMLFWGFAVFALSYVFVYIAAPWTGDLPRELFGSLGSQVFSLFLEIFALLVTLAVIWAAYRRYVMKPERLEPSLEAGLILALVFVLMMTAFVVDGLQIAATGEGSAVWLPIGVGFSKIFGGANGIEESLARNLHHGFWWAHMIILLGFLVYIPYSKHLHIVASPFNVFFRSSRPKGALAPIDIETTETLGAGKIEEFTWKQLLDCYACAQCGRCQVNCPAYISGKPLNPKEVILDLKDHLLEEGKLLRTSKGLPLGKDHGRRMIGDAVTEDEIWACTTCRACQEQCPVANEHIDKIIDMRRNLVLVQNRIPETAERALRSLMTRGDPWPGTLYLREDWAKELNIKKLSEDSGVDILYWVGCTGALADVNLPVTACLARVLTAAGVNFGILGAEESCCGDPARRMGHELQFQAQVLRNIETLKRYNVTRIVTHCPHCYNTLAHEYPQFGGDFEVVHYTELVANLIGEGKLKLSRVDHRTITYQDPCYLGRYNDVYRVPRAILEALPGTRLVEMGRHGRESFCCGGGGGRLWMEEQIGRKINEIRIEDAIEVGADVIATACPYCLQMFEEAIERKKVNESLQALDIIQLVEQAISEAQS